MKKLLIVLILILSLAGPAYGESLEQFITSTQATSKAVNTDWLSSDFAPGLGFNSNVPVKFGLLISVSVANVVNVACTHNSVESKFDLNSGNTLTAGAWYYFDLAFPPTVTACNLQSETATADVTVFVYETTNLDL